MPKRSYRFSALIAKGDEWYVAHCPELDVTSQGETVERARTNLREAIELYIETWGLPEGLQADEQPFVTFVEVAT